MIHKAWIEKHGPSWRVRMRDKGRKTTIQSGLMRREAGRIRNDINEKLQLGKKVIGMHSTVDHLVARIVEILRPQMSAEYCDLIVRSMRLLGAHAGPRLAQIDVEAVDSMKADLLKRGRSCATVNKYLRHCSAGLQKAVEWGMLVDNPMDDVATLVEPERDVRIVSLHDETRLLAACSNVRDRCIVHLGIAGGLRAKEIAQLNIKDDFNEDTGEIRIVNRDGALTKTRKQRVVYVFDRDRKAELIALARSRQGRGQFPFYDRNSSCVSQRLIQIRRRARVECTLHDLRRTCATRQLLTGVPVPVVAKWMGHSIRVMEEFYTRISTDDLMQVRSKMHCVQNIERPEADLIAKG